MLVAEGEIGRLKVVCAAQDFAFMGGSMGMHVGNAIVAAAERATKRKCPMVLFAAAGGARMQEGILSLMQMPRRRSRSRCWRRTAPPLRRGPDPPDDRRGDRELRHARRHPDRRARGADLLRRPAGHRARPSARPLPRAFQRAEYLLDGMLDRVVARKDLRDELATVLLGHLTNQPAYVHGELPAPVETRPPRRRNEPRDATRSSTG